MKVLIHSNGVPLFSAGGYNTQIRKLIKGFSERGITVRCLITGINAGKYLDFNSYRVADLAQKFKLFLDPDIPQIERDILSATEFHIHTEKIKGERSWNNCR